MEKIFKIGFYVLFIVIILLFFLKDVNFKKMFYKDIKEIKNPDDILVLVNKNNKLPNDYIPNGLEEINIKYSNEGKLLRHEARFAFEALSSDALKEGYKIIAVSAYRTYTYQEKLFNNYIEEYGEDYALNCSARPGHSEHQTGLSLDVMGTNNSYDDFEESNEFEWMIDNAHKYGFILRYPKGKENITGYKYEPWHYRYVGVDVAKEIYKNDITLEEYLNK
ncbi:MAG: M15 family metallopeptidase [Clostridium sp.]|nr:M15 family metallopeptidase [Clostridium sp.]MCM1444646.1 M15 family metallopeptidase [Candidatus Amulumruptor caecigallinarius]